MTNQNRSSESDRWRRAYDEEDQRSQRRRDQDDDWRREDASERRFGRDEAHSRGSRSYGGTGETEPWEQGGYGAGARRYAERDSSGDYNQNRSYENQRGGRQEYGHDYGGQGGYGGQALGGQRYGGQRYGSQDFGGQEFSGQGLGGQRYGGQDFGGQRLGGQRLGGQDFGGQRYGSQDSAGQRYGGQDFSGQRYGGRDYAGQRYGGQEPEGQYGRSEYGTPQYGAFGGITEGSRQGREGQQFGSGASGASQNTGAWQRGEHRGKGPKGYKRSDDRIREDVCDRLSDDDELDASDITVNVKDGEVTLEGTVNDRRAKQRAEDLAESVGGVRDVDNKLRKNKGMLQEMGEKLTGSQNNERGHSGSGTKNTPPNASMSR